MTHPIASPAVIQRIVVGTIVLAMLAACSQVAPIGAGAGGTDREHLQAQDALTRWAAAVASGGGQQGFVPVGELTGQVGDWEEDIGENNKEALMGGRVVAATTLESRSPGDGVVRWEDGTTRTLPAISAAQALEELKARGQSDCTACVALSVTSARLSTATIQTSRGPATAPAWEFTVAGTKVRVTRVAIAARDGISVNPPAWNPDDPATGISIESASGIAGATQLIVTFTGAPDPADKPCGADYTAEAVESASAVVVIVVSHERGPLGACAAVGAVRTATVTLATPLGQRAVLEVKEGLPVPVHLTP